MEDIIRNVLPRRKILIKVDQLLRYRYLHKLISPSLETNQLTYREPKHLRKILNIFDDYRVLSINDSLMVPRNSNYKN